MSAVNSDQEAFWTRFADVWVAQQGDLDSLFAPVLDLVMHHAALQPGDCVLDVGCGTGTSTKRAASLVSATGRARGIDISAPMLERARHEARNVANVTFKVADAAEFPFEKARYDHVISRFGVMFFNDPVAAFSNIVTGLKPGAQITMAAWSHLNQNPWFLAPMRAAKDRLGAPPPVDPDAPGPLAFRDIERVCNILERSGFVDVNGRSVSVTLTPRGNLNEVSRQACSIGPASRTMEHFEGSDEDFKAIALAVENSFAPYMSPKGAQIPSEINIFTGRAPTS